MNAPKITAAHLEAVIYSRDNSLAHAAQYRSVPNAHERHRNFAARLSEVAAHLAAQIEGADDAAQ